MKVAIVCGAPSSEMLAPFDNKDWEIWVLGNRVKRHLDKRVTRIFEIHDNLSEHGDIQAYADSLVYLGIPMVVGENFPSGGSHVKKYPYDEVEKLYGSLYLTSSPAYMLAYAILRGATDIAIYGVDLSISDHEYFWQRPCVEAWIGFAKGRGINVTIPEVSHVGKSKYIEGRDWNNDTEVGVFSEDSFNALADQHKESKNNIQEERRRLALKAALHDGAEQTYRHLARVARAVEAQVDVTDLMQTTVLR